MGLFTDRVVQRSFFPKPGFGSQHDTWIEWVRGYEVTVRPCDQREFESHKTFAKKKNEVIKEE